MNWEEIEELMNETSPQGEYIPDLSVLDENTEYREESPVHNELLQLPFERFDSRKELLSVVRALVLIQGYAISIKRSQKDKYVVIGCDMRGSYRTHNNLSVKNRKRKSASRLVASTFEVRGWKNVNFMGS